MAGKPSQVLALDGLEFALDDFEGSAEVSGVVAFEAEEYVAFDCTFEGGQIAFVWVDDHLVCHTNPPFGSSNSSTDGCPENPLRGTDRSTSGVPILIHIYSRADALGNTTSGAQAYVSVRWAKLRAPAAAGAKPKVAPVPPSALSPHTPPLETTRREMQRKLAVGWSLWSNNLLDVVRLPHSFALGLAVCQLSTRQCLRTTRIEDAGSNVRVGSFAVDLSYWQFYMQFNGLNVSLSFCGGEAALSLLAEPVGCDTSAANCSDFALLVSPRFMWMRGGKLQVGNDGRIRLTAAGMTPSTLILATAPSAGGLPLPGNVTAAPHVALTFAGGAVALQEGLTRPSVAGVRQVVAAARAKERQRYAAYGEFAEVKEAVQAATMWNFIYTPAEYGPVLPVSRSWNFVRDPSTDDFKYVLFDWDNIFASYLTSLDPSPAAKAIAYSNFIQVVRSRTAQGFVPNFAAGGYKSVDRTEPQIGAKVLLEMYNKYKEDWLVELLFDDLLGWAAWFERERMFGPLGIVSLGSDSISGFTDYSAGQMQGARFESGLDNSPMYDGDMFNASVASIGSRRIGQMQLYDVGMASMFVQDVDALAVLARRIGREATATKLDSMASLQRQKICKHLWDDVQQIFANRFWNGTRSTRITPTSFYAMMARAASDEQASVMVSKWLLSPNHFCISPKGDFSGNDDDCYWGLPSIQRSDAAFPPLGYWRGYVWGPMAQLTYWSLQQYDHLPIVRTARQALCKQMTALLLSQWRAHRHICENYSPHKTADDHKGDCSGTKFYHWGALNGMISMVEAGLYGAHPTNA